MAIIIVLGQFWVFKKTTVQILFPETFLVRDIKNDWYFYLPLVQQSWVSGNGDAQLFVPQIRPLSQSESSSQSPSSTSHRCEEVQQSPVV